MSEKGKGSSSPKGKGKDKDRAIAAVSQLSESGLLQSGQSEAEYLFSLQAMDAFIMGKKRGKASK